MFKILNLRKFFTDCFEILTQPCLRIRACFYVRDGTGRDGMGRDGMGWDGMGWDGTGWDRTGRDGIGRDGTGPQQRVAGYS
jgi:hypothetical protein